MNEAPSFIVKPDSVEIAEGGKVKFVCKVRGKPLPDLSWLKDEKAIAETDNTQVDYQQDIEKIEVESVLSLKKMSASDESVYKVEAENAIGGISHPFSLVMNWAPEIVKAPAAVELIEGEAASLVVVATGKPLPQIAWQKDGNAMEDANITVSQNEQEVRSTLALQAVAQEHEGKYKVNATNSVGSAKAEFPITGIQTSTSSST